MKNHFDYFGIVVLTASCPGKYSGTPYARSAGSIAETAKLKEVSAAKIRGRVSRQEFYIKPGSEYSVIVLEGCEIVK